MKLKYNFIMQNVENQSVAVAVGKDNAKFNGMIRMNSSGAVIFEMLKNDIGEEQIVMALLRRYEIAEDVAKKAVKDFVKILRENGLIIE